MPEKSQYIFSRTKMQYNLYLCMYIYLLYIKKIRTTLNVHILEKSEFRFILKYAMALVRIIETLIIFFFFLTR